MLPNARAVRIPDLYTAKIPKVIARPNNHEAATIRGKVGFIGIKVIFPSMFLIQSTYVIRSMD
jgi:hypothetical protein